MNVSINPIPVEVKYTVIFSDLSLAEVIELRKAVSNDPSFYNIFNDIIRSKFHVEMDRVMDETLRRIVHSRLK